MVGALARRPELALEVHASENIAERLAQSAPAAKVVAHPRRPLPLRLVVEQLVIARRSKRYDVVLPLGNFLLFGARRPQVLTAQNAWYFTDDVRRFRRLHCPPAMRLRLAIESAAARASIRRATVVVAVSCAMRAAISEDLGPRDNLRVVLSATPELPAPGQVPPGLPDEPFVLMVAHDDPHKEWGRVASAFEADTGLPPLVIVGRQRRSNLEDSPRVRILGEISDASELAALYEAAACCLAHSRFESFGLTPVEALRSGTPVAASDLPAHREACGDDAVYYPPESITELAQAVRRAIGRGTVASPTSARRTWDQAAGELASIIAAVSQSG
jgi:glycosyltransferase involved in cell wall biosynthesis